ncbi:transcriptional regulator, AsnC family [Colwellia chukchiensis]|uniref:Leucine-responsive regulatory protein n=1 Tax=Colwellia chukchiensis TaxID=641665 RepID=A0A1H7L847_9GAMM|nr:winged helix-turn-helix transcriptional regulator [Colwellia chukchiensis]SEK95131.1 transcriptional regulator, AsnC family [Colwellia chukchiensis]
MTTSKPRVLDRIDLTILDILQKNGRISNHALAQHVNLSASPCLERVKRLEQDGYIERYGAFLNASKLKYGMTAFIQVTLDRTTADIFNKFRAQVIEIKEVAECHMVAGGFDYLLKIRFKDMAAYRVLLGTIVELPGISQTHTYIVTEHVKRHSGVPIFE